MCFNLACEPNKEDIEMDSSDRDQAALMNVAISKHEERTDRIDAINKLTNQDYLESIAVDTSNSCYIRIAAIKKLTNDAVLKVLAIGETEKHEYDKSIANAFILSMSLSLDDRLIDIVNKINPLQYHLKDSIMDKIVYEYYMYQTGEMSSSLNLNMKKINTQLLHNFKQQMSWKENQDLGVFGQYLGYAMSAAAAGLAISHLVKYKDKAFFGK